MAQNDIYQIKVTLNHSKPPIWRRLQVPGQTRLDELHLMLQVAMGWWNEHLHQFTVGQTTYSELRPDLEMWEPEFMDESKYRLNQIAPGEKSKFVYEYDFGDSWEHVILVEKVLPPEQGVHYPRCIKGKRACPPEDIGGVWGYGYFLEAIKDPNHPEHADMREWVGDDFDPEVFDLEEVNEALQRFS
jgi:hypothetical protein